MILSVSRRTDIPCRYSEWFMNRIREGSAVVRNPFNAGQLGRIPMTPEAVDCIVFWTKDPQPLMPYLKELDNRGYRYYFQFTLTAYGTDLEPGVADKDEMIKIFRRLSRRIGPERVVWRYDPVLLGGDYTIQYHREWFEKMCRALCGYTESCVISFLDMYSRIKKNTEYQGILPLSQEDIRILASILGPIAARYGIRMSTCSEEMDLEEYGIRKGKCIDDRLIESITGHHLDVKKDDTQRASCGCVKSVDIGTYHTCAHFCRYCYANLSQRQVEENRRQHNPDSPLLIGSLRGDEKITPRGMKSVIKKT